MKSSPTPLISDLVLVGGGHAHVHALKMFGMAPLKSTIEENGIQITLISSTVLTPYSGMLPGIVAGHYTAEESHLDLRKLCSFSGIRFIHAAATGVTYDSIGGGGGWISCSDGRPDVRYDTLSIDIGCSPTIPDSLCSNSDSDSAETVTPVKPISTFSQRWDGICERLKKSSPDAYTPKRPFILLVVGAGAGGIELALSAHHTLLNILEEKSYPDPAGSIKIVLVTRGMDLLPSHNAGVRRIFCRILQERNIDVQYGAEAIGVNSEIDASGVAKKSLKLSDSSCNQSKISFDECLWCTSAGASSWLSEKTPFETTTDGFIKVNDTYETVSHKGVFSAGDCCHMVHNPRPKAGVFAVRAGPIVKDNLIAYLVNKPLTPHEPQKEFLGLISTGGKYAVASRGEHALEGEFLWRLKDEIDRTWMDMYQILPSVEDMDEEELDASDQKSKHFVPPILASRGKDALAAFTEAPMRCGGCGAKVGSRTLTRVLDTVHSRRLAQSCSDATQQKKPNKIDPDDAAIVMLPKTGGGAMIQTIDFFRSFISDPFVFGKIAAVHAMSDCHAMGAKAQTALALAVVQFAANEAMTERTLVDMLSGASDVLDEDDCELAGGHTCEGAEQALGFAVSGFIEDPSMLLRKRGGKIGDKIVLTKAVGTGALFAADMRAKCRGEMVEEAIESMTTSNGPASRIAMETIKARLDEDEDDRGVHSCTDVTGFGLCGHLLEMLVANDDSDEMLDLVSASLDINAIPFFRGATEAVADGILSSLYRENSRSRRSVSNHEEAAKSYPFTYPLLFDPQTAGGLLFFVSPEVCDDFVQKLSNDTGTKVAAVIGELTAYTSLSSELDVCEIDGSCTPTANRIHIHI